MAPPPEGQLLRRSAGPTRLRGDRMDRQTGRPVSAASPSRNELSWSEILRAAFDGTCPGDKSLEALLDRLERRASPR